MGEQVRHDDNRLRAIAVPEAVRRATCRDFAPLPVEAAAAAMLMVLATRTPAAQHGQPLPRTW